MHLVTKSYFDDFCTNFGAPYTESKNFEAFANYCVFSKFSSDSVEVDDLVYEGADPGIDGAMLFLDDRAVFSVDELKEIFRDSRREYHVTVVLTQAKSSISWKKIEIDSFSAAISDFLGENPAQPHSPFLAEFKLMFKLIFANIGKVRNGLPDIEAHFITAAPNTEATEILAAFLIGEGALIRLGYSYNTKFLMTHRDRIHELWLGADGPMEAKLPTIGYAPFPSAPNINNAYVATVSARSFIDTVLKNEDGSVRKKLFEENVRDFLGIDAEVNSEISLTLEDDIKRARFGLMNNGITIVARSVRPAGQEIFIRDFQIVNGCQTSNVLINRDELVDGRVSLMVKLIEADDAAVIDDIVKATNRQSKVEDAQFASTLNLLRELEKYFNVRGAKESNSLFFERRKGQYGSDNIAAVRIFDVRETARCFAAANMMRPDLASRYPNRLTGDLLHEVFKEGQPEEAYYTSCFAHYRLKMLISNKKFDARYSKLRWHIICAASKFCGSKFKELECTSKNEALYRLFAENEGAWFNRLSNLITQAIPNPDISRDLLKSPPLTSEILSKVDDLV